ncbi:MAG: hypothetical protein V3R83_10975 [Gammaproteobacteria bacterium]
MKSNPNDLATLLDGFDHPRSDNPFIWSSRSSDLYSLGQWLQAQGRFPRPTAARKTHGYNYIVESGVFHVDGYDVIHVSA